MTDELDSSMLNCQNKPFASQKERYDAQFSRLVRGFNNEVQKPSF